jgi:Protein kinase domain
MGRVYLGRSAGGRSVAVKVIRAELAADPEFRARFRREVAAARKVSGLYTASVVDADTDGPVPWLATVYVAGPTLAAAVKTHGPLSADLVLALAAMLAESLAAIHAVGVVHRDLKPSNVLLAEDGPRVIDFGISRAAEGSSVLTHSGQPIGSPGFMSPEQAEGLEVGPPSDVFSLGAVLTFASSGHAPFGGLSTPAQLFQVVHRPPRLDDVPDEIRGLVEYCLAKDPGQRPAAADLLAMLDDANVTADWRPTRIIKEHPEAVPADPPPDAAFHGSMPDPAETPARGQARGAGPHIPAGGAIRPEKAKLTRNGITTVSPMPAGGRPAADGSLLLQPARPGDRRPAVGRRLLSGRAAGIAAPIAVAVAAVAVLVVLVTGHATPKAGPLTANGGSGGSTPSVAALNTYPGEQQRDVFQVIQRVVASGRTIVAIGSETAGAAARQEFFVSADGGASWRLAPLRMSGGGSPPRGYQASLLAGGPGGWLAIGTQAIWTSQDGLSWTLAARHGITPQYTGDRVMVVTKTSAGFLAAGSNNAAEGAPQAVIWTSRDGVTWQRMTAAQLGLAAPGARVAGIAYATSQGDDTLISGTVDQGGSSYSGVWLSTDGGSAWMPVPVPVSNGGGPLIAGLAFDDAGFIAVRNGATADDGVAYFSQNGQAWQYAGTISAPGGFRPNVVKGSDYGFVVTGMGGNIAYTSTGTGASWQPTASLGPAGDTINGVTVAPGGTVIAVGYTPATKVSQQAVFIEATTAGSVRPVPLAHIPGAITPEAAINSRAIANGEQIAVGSADGYPAIWKASHDRWVLVSTLSLVSAEPGLGSLRSVTHGPSGWRAVGAPGLVFTSTNGTTWSRVP